MRVVPDIPQSDYVAFGYQFAVPTCHAGSGDRIGRTGDKSHRLSRLLQRANPTVPVTTTLFHKLDQVVQDASPLL